MTSGDKEFDRLAEWLLFALIIGTTFLQKIGLDHHSGHPRYAAIGIR